MKNIHLIGNAHLDPVWLWRWQEGYSEVLATFRSALDRIKEYDDFVFTCAGAAYYKWVEETDCEMFEEIKNAVKLGKWIIVGGWWIQPDCNAPSGESFARHSLYSQRYFKEKFGVTAKVGYNVDSFGHNGMLPQLLKQSGMTGYVYMRPMNNEKDYPFEERTFKWIGVDGSEIPAFRIPESYCANMFKHLENKVKTHLEISDKTKQPIMCFYGVGNHGGGPTIDNLEFLNGLKKENKRYIYSSPNEFFEEIKNEELPELKGDLQHHASGCYTAVMSIKELNRKSEAMLLAAEKFNSIANLNSLGKYENTEDIWQTVMFNQFHDILGGCCIREAMEDSEKALGGAYDNASQILNRSLQALAWNIDTSKGLEIKYNRMGEKTWEQDNLGTPIVVFNPNSWEVTAPVDIAVKFNGVTDNNGKPVAWQRVRSSLTNCSSDKWGTRFLANVEPFGWKLYWLYGEKEQPYENKLPLIANEEKIENNWLKVAFKDGEIVSIYDKTSQKELLKDKIKGLIINEEKCDTWAHDIHTFDDVIGEFSDWKADIVENGDVCVTVRLVGKYNNSTVRILCTLYRELKEMNMSFMVDWREEHKMLKFAFPTVFTNGKDICGIPYGYIERTANGKEQPMQNFVEVCEENCGLSVMTDTRSAYSLKDGELRITALRSPIFADHFGARDDRCEFTEQREHFFEMWVTPMVEREDVYRKALTLNSKLIALNGTYHKGKLPTAKGNISLDKENIVVTVFKRSEDKSGDYIIRCHETKGETTKAKILIDLLNTEFETVFLPQQIKTFRIKGGKVIENNFLED